MYCSLISILLRKYFLIRNTAKSNKCFLFLNFLSFISQCFLFVSLFVEFFFYFLMLTNTVKNKNNWKISTDKFRNFSKIRKISEKLLYIQTLQGKNRLIWHKISYWSINKQYNLKSSFRKALMTCLEVFQKISV